MATMETITERDGVKIITTHFIDGAFVESRGRKAMDIIKPTNGKVSARVTLGDEGDTVDGEKRSLMLASPRHLDTFVRMDGAWRYVTALVRAQQAEESLRTVQAELAHVSRVTTLGQLTASIAHEITQPIASARNNARAALNFLARQPPELGDVREALSCIVGDVDRAGDIIDRIRDHIKKSPPRKARFDLNVTINEVLVLARSAINKNGVSVQTRLAEGLLPVHGDRVQLQQVVLNLILNAVEAMGSVEARERDLRISTEPNQPGGVLLAVRDSGPGIDPENLERVFEAFYTTKSSGVGMGLSICRSIIDAHGGRLWADVNEPRGAAFRFTLPAAENS
jgi:C4-dicarboxylate-specific signal transduction histidine kinase